MSSLLELIEAAVAEDERVAREADNRESNWWWGPDAESAAERHIARNDPKRGLRRADSYRRIVAHVLWQEARYDEDCGCGHTTDDIVAGRCRSVKLEENEILLALAAELNVPCGARATFWPDDEACEAECILHIGHDGDRHEDEILGEWTEDELSTHGRFE